MRSGDQSSIEDLNLDKQLIEKINKFAPIKHILKNQSNNTAFLHTSWTEWKNMFSFEIFCTLGKIDIKG